MSTKTSVEVPTPIGQSSLGGEAITCTVYRNGKSAGHPSDLGRISEILDEPDSLVWFDVVDPEPDDLELLREEFDLHPLAIEDAIHAHERPKIESYGDYWFLVILAADADEGRHVILREIAIFAGQKFLVTVRHDPAYSLDEVEQRWESHPEQLRCGGGLLLYTLLDAVVDGYFPVEEMFADRVEELERRLFDDGPRRDNVLRDIFQMKQDAQQFRRAVVPMRDILNPIIRGDVAILSGEEVIYFRDVYDHAVRVIEQVDTLRDLMSSALEIHLSVVANRQNEVTKQLAVIATIFLPLSFLVGFFGQNFSFLVNHISGTGVFWILGVGLELSVVALMLVYFKYRRWF